MNMDQKSLIHELDDDEQNQNKYMPEIDENYMLEDTDWVPADSVVNMVLIGDTSTGKTAQILKFMYPKFVADDKIKPTGADVPVLDLKDKDVTVYGARIHAKIQDTSGDRDDVVQRRTYIKKSSVVMICFSVDQKDNSRDCVERWVREVRGVDPHKPIVFVLTKKDLLPE